MTGADGYWLDELAVRATRGRFLRTTIAAVGGLVFPLVRAHPATSAANDPTACRKGCFYMAHRTADRTLQACRTSVRQQALPDLLATLWVSPFLGGAMLLAEPSHEDCADRTLLVQKATLWDCMQPDCPGFDPAAAGGPCDGCQAAGGHCCPDQAVVSGYSCCTGTGGCCDPSGNGCASGVTACGG